MADLFKEIVPSILETKKDVLDDEKDYKAFIVNKALSVHYDCIFYANQMNMLPCLDNNLQYHYFINSIRAYKRPYQKWPKRETIENLNAVMEYYNYSPMKAREALKVLSDSDIDEIKRLLNKGGVNDKPQRFNRSETV